MPGARLRARREAMTRRAGPQQSEPVAGFFSLDASSPEDWVLLLERRRELYAGLADKALHHLGSMSDETFGWPISRKQHCLQAATRAQRDVARDEM